MGLAVYWEFVFAGDWEAGVRLVEGLRSAADNAGFDQVSGLVEGYAEKHVEGDEEAAADRAWAMSQGLVTLHRPTESDPGRVIRVAPSAVVAFRACIAGAEDAPFGLAMYPEAVTVADERVETGLSGLKWMSGCGTQGASKRGGMSGFLKAHRAVISVLDKARSLGAKVVVKDDGEYWEKRDQKLLLDKLEEWEGLMAALGRQRKDSRGQVTLACEVKPRLEALKKTQKRLDRAPVEGLEG